ncbi:MAG TPA: bifunctional phosphoribosyl-AMP cyclohydrolase/phosphoribosyl-ATP diphosphatase HisIE [Haliangiales bacterium]|nr:bifunctional phosphoribosyl-AMP cyclohydrolase/phosphoribosyl-ATP diphosphatase HisIE [Haliangiales bacterium]
MLIAWDDRGLVPAVAQDATTGAVLMVAWMNAEALERTRATGEAHFFSRSRQALWRKGETSGHVLRVREIRVDCDGDVLLLACDPSGPACHTGKPSCFFRVLDGPEDDEGDEGPPGAPAAVLDRLARAIEARRTATAEASYTRSLLDAGMPKILAKIAEEAGELAAELANGTEPAIVHETADLFYHVLVGLAARGVPPSAIWDELERRFGRSGHAEKAARRRE